jgi:hypothetical protein
VYETLETIEEGLGALLGTFDPRRLNQPDAVTALERFARIEQLATAGKVLVGQRVVEAECTSSGPRVRPGSSRVPDLGALGGADEIGGPAPSEGAGSDGSRGPDGRDPTAGTRRPTG